MEKKIILFTIGNIKNASSRIRGIEYLKLFNEANYDTFLVPRTPNLERNSFLNKILFFALKQKFLLKRILLLFWFRKEKFIIQKLFISKFEVFLIKIFNISYFFDFDDAIYTESKEALIKTKNQIINAKGVFCANPTLLEFSSKINSNSILIPTPIDTDIIVPNKSKSKKNDIITIGWIGSPWTQHYLEELNDIFLKLDQLGYNFELMLVGTNTSLKLQSKNKIIKPWYLNCEKKYLQMFDIGIMPLTNDTYSIGKSGYKLLLYMAAGISNISSPVGVNKDIVNHKKSGILADTKEEWLQAFIQLFESKSLREQFGLQSREIVKQTYSRHVVFKNILNNIERTYDTK